MQKIKKSKRETIEKLRMILDNPDIKDSTINDETHLSALQKRLVEPSKESVIYSDTNYSEQGDSLKAKVTIHRKVESSFTTTEQKHLVTDKIKEEVQKENLFEDEELYEIEKVEFDVPEFVEVKPNDIEETKDEIPTWETVTNLEEKETSDIDNELPEWEPAEPEYVEIEEKPEKEKTKTIKKIPEWEPISIEDNEEKLNITEKHKEVKETLQKPMMEYNNKINVFRDIKNIDEKTAILLYDNGYLSIDDLRVATLKDLTGINGIKRRLAKKIKKEIREKLPVISDSKIDRKVVETKVEKDFMDSKVNQIKENGYKYGEYVLYKKEVKLGSDKIRTIHYFSKYKPNDGKQVQLPDGYEIRLNKKTGVPYIRKKII